MLANLRAAFFNRQTVHVGGGEFTPEEVKAFVGYVTDLQRTLHKLDPKALEDLEARHTQPANS